MRNFLFDQDSTETEWLKGCIIAIWDNHENACFDTRWADDEKIENQLSYEDIISEETLGVTIGTTLLLRGKPYKVHRVDLYTSMFDKNPMSDERVNGIRLQVVIVLNTNFFDNPY